MMTYTKPRIVSTVAAAVAVRGNDKSQALEDNIVGTPSAYEADE